MTSYIPPGIYSFKGSNGNPQNNVWNVFQVNNKDTRTFWDISIWN